MHERREGWGGGRGGEGGRDGGRDRLVLRKSQYLPKFPVMSIVKLHVTLLMFYNSSATFNKYGRENIVM